MDTEELRIKFLDVPGMVLQMRLSSCIPPSWAVAEEKPSPAKRVAMSKTYPQRLNAFNVRSLLFHYFKANEKSPDH